MNLAVRSAPWKLLWRYIRPLHFRSRFRFYIAPTSLFVPSYWDLLRRRPFVFGFWVLSRRLRFLVTGILGSRAKSTTPAGSSHVVARVLPYNKRNSWGFQRERTERLMNVLRSIPTPDTENSKVLCIGPRNEAEILLLSTYGFNLKHINAIDLFSYSPLIDVMDMHDLQYDDSQFDLVYSAFALTYSEDMNRACAEAVRVCKDGGLMAIASGFPYSEAPQIGTLLPGGLDDLLGYFAGHIKHIYWKEENPPDSVNRRGSVIFSICK